MSFFSRTARFLLTASLLAAALPAFAQEATPEPAIEQPPLLELLALIPNTPEALTGVPLISYVDYAAIENARPDVPAFESWAAFNQSLEADTDAAALWMQNSMRIVAGPDFYLRYLRQFADTEARVGFDVFDIDRAIVVGQPPAMGTILEGDFDVDAVTEAYLARDYAAGQNNGVVLLSSADGAPGTTIDFDGIDLAIPFGGPLGRREPIAVTDEFILNSPNDGLLDAMVNAYVGYRPSLYTQPDLVAAAEALTTGQGQLLQALFLNPLDVAFPGIDPVLILTPDIDTETLMDANPHGYGPLPLYSAVVMADLQDGVDQVAMLALVYDDEATARAAADELTARLADYPIRRSQNPTPMVELVDGAHLGKPNVYYSPGTGKYVALASVRYPMPDNVLVDMATGEPIAEGEDAAWTGYLQSGRLFRMWFDALLNRDFDILAVTE